LCGAKPPQKLHWTNAVVLGGWVGGPKPREPGAGARYRCVSPVRTSDAFFTQHVWSQNQLPALRACSGIGRDFSWRYGFPSFTPWATNTAFFADLAPQKGCKSLI
jgi:hypothetical protein